MATKLILRRGTRAQLDALAASNGLLQGEQYFITDENKLAIGISVSTYTEIVGGSSSSPLEPTAFGAL